MDASLFVWKNILLHLPLAWVVSLCTQWEIIGFGTVTNFGSNFLCLSTLRDPPRTHQGPSLTWRSGAKGIVACHAPVPMLQEAQPMSQTHEGSRVRSGCTPPHASSAFVYALSACMHALSGQCTHALSGYPHPHPTPLSESTSQTDLCWHGIWLAHEWYGATTCILPRVHDLMRTMHDDGYFVWGVVGVAPSIQFTLNPKFPTVTDLEG